MVLLFLEDAHLYNLFKHNLIKYGSGKIVLSLYKDIQQLEETLSAKDKEVELLLMQASNNLNVPDNIREIQLTLEDRYDASGKAISFSLCRTFEDLMALISLELEHNDRHGSTLCKTYFGICDETVSRTSMMQRLSSMAGQYEKQVLIIDLDLPGEVNEDIRVNSERALYQLLNNGKVQWNSLVCQEHSKLLYFKPFTQIADTRLLQPTLIKCIEETASKQGVNFIMLLHKGGLNAWTLSWHEHFSMCFVVGSTFDRDRVRWARVANQEILRFFSSGSTGQAGDVLTEWHMYMNNEMRSEGR